MFRLPSEAKAAFLSLVNRLKNLLKNILFLVRKNKGRQDQPFYGRPENDLQDIVQ